MQSDAKGPESGAGGVAELENGSLRVLVMACMAWHGTSCAYVEHAVRCVMAFLFGSCAGSSACPRPIDKLCEDCHLADINASLLPTTSLTRDRGASRVDD